jgi:AcrR family transcriptional regulator
VDRASEILDAASKEIVRVGMNRLRVQDVAAAAGVSTALVHYYFKTRDALLVAAFKYADAVSAAYGSKRGTTGLESTTLALQHELLDHPTVRASGVIWSEAAANAVFHEELNAVVKQWTTNWIRDIAKLIDEGIGDGSVLAEADSRVSAQRLTALVESLSVRCLLDITPRSEAIALLTSAIDAELQPRE